MSLTPEEQWLREHEHAALMSRAFPPIDRPPGDPPRIEDQSPAQESPAVDSDQRAVLMCPRGVRYTLLLISLLKRALQDETLRPAVRLQLLEQLDELADTSVLTAIAPMDDAAVRILHVAMSLDAHLPAEPPHHASFDMLTRGDVFAHFISLNPSLLTAIKMPQRVSHRAIIRTTSRTFRITEDCRRCL
jgi:hypothetical protein